MLDLANEQKQAEPIGRELADIAQIVRGDETFQLYLADPGISQHERGGVVQRIFGRHVSPLIYNFLGVLSNKKAMSLLTEIADAYDVPIGRKEVQHTHLTRRADPRASAPLRI